MRKLLVIMLALLWLPAIASAATLSKPGNNLGLMGYWSFNEGAGTIAHDFSGHGDNGTLSGAALPAWINGKLSNGLSFNGTSSYVSAASAPGFNNTQISFCAWANMTSNPSGFTQIVGTSGGTGAIFVNSSGQVFGQITVSVGGNQGTPKTNISSGWHFYCVTWSSGAKISLYVDGALSQQSSSVVTDTITSMSGVWIGRYSSGTYFPGSIDEPRIYNRALSATEVAALYQAGAARVSGVPAVGMIGRWAFDEGSASSAVVDSSGYGNSGTATLPNRITGKFGGAFDFSNSGYVSIPVTGAQFARYPISFAFWAKTTSTGFISFAKRVLPAANGSTAYAQGLNLLLTGGGKNTFGIRIDNNTGSNWNIYPVATAINDGNWHFLVATISSTGRVTLYQDGAQTGAGTISGVLDSTGGDFGFPSANDTSLGCPATASVQMDEMRVFNRVLSAAEVTSMYHQTSTGKLTANASSASLSATGSLSSGLVGLWTFDGRDVYQNVADKSGQGNTGYLVGYSSTSSALTIGKMGQAIKFSSGKYIDVPTSSTLNPSVITVSAWFNPTASGAYRPFVAKVDSSATTGWEMAYNYTTGALRATLRGSLVDAAGGTVALNTWQLGTFTYDGTTLRLYLNGTQVATATGSATLSSAVDLTIGKRAINNDQFIGPVDDVRVYNRVLSATEVKQLYNMGK